MCKEGLPVTQVVGVNEFVKKSSARDAMAIINLSYLLLVVQATVVLSRSTIYNEGYAMYRSTGRNMNTILSYPAPTN